jgi:xylan 1,4-beta-xylosidase
MQKLIVIGAIFSCLGLLAISAVFTGRDQTAQPAPIDVVLSGDFPDPSIIRDGDVFYMTHSSHDYVPGLLIWRSKNLVDWEREGYALKRNLGDVWAPDFVKFGDRYFIYFPAAGTNWVVTASSPEGPWSDPVDLKISGIDPGHIAAADGKRYLYQDDGYVVELAADGLSLAGKRRRVYEGWRYPEDWTVEGFYLESPKLMFSGGMYYLASAEGGTAGPGTSHMVVLARAKTPLGPWENCPFNPIVRTWSKTERYLSKGHGTIFQSGAGEWFIVYHAYENGYLPLGRQTLIERLVRTPDGWFRTVRNPRGEGEIRKHRNVIIESDDFSAKDLKLQWQFSGLESLEDVELGNGVLTLPCVADGIRAMHAIPDDHNFEVTVKLEPEKGVEAGLILFYNQKVFAGIGIKDGFIFTLSRGEMTSNPMVEAPRARYFKLKLFEFDLTMQYSEDGFSWKTYPNSLEVSGYQHNMLGGFSSLKIGVYGLGSGRLRIGDFTYKIVR